MVVFACNACGESLKKNQVENHYQRKCRNCSVLSCLDCGKDFWGNDYEQHTKCISEEEKYSGKNFVPKPGSNKNEIKQQQWLQQVQEAVEKCRTNPRLKSVLLRLKDQPNVPRKKNKFVNFLSNGFNVRDPNLAAQVWDMLMANTEDKKQDSSQSENNSSNKSENHSTESVNSKESSADSKNTVNIETDNVSENATEVDSKKLSKREKKEERRKKLHKAEKKDKNIPVEVDQNVLENGTADTVSKKKSKRKEKTESKKSKKRKREEDNEAEGEEVEENTENQSGSEQDTEQPAKKKFKTKFNWNETVVEVLQTKGPEMKTKKLRKKVLAEYLSQGCTEKSEEKLWARFENKLKKIPEVKIIGDKVKLKNAS